MGVLKLRIRSLSVIFRQNTGVNATMIKRELISRTAAVLRENNIRKPVSIPKQVLHISDDDGNSKDFTVKKADKKMLYTTGDVSAILNACMYVIQEALRRGEEVSIYGFGKLDLKYRKEHMVCRVLDGEMVKAVGHYLPRFLPGDTLRRSAQIYEQSLKDQEINSPLPVFYEEEDE